eukprot:7937225-Pyramimonas_sp.AAC.1
MRSMPPAPCNATVRSVNRFSFLELPPVFISPSYPRRSEKNSKPDAKVEIKAEPLELPRMKRPAAAVPMPKPKAVIKRPATATPKETAGHS